MISGGNLAARGYTADVVQTPKGGIGLRVAPAVVVVPEANAGLVALLGVPVLADAFRKRK